MATNTWSSLRTWTTRALELLALSLISVIVVASSVGWRASALLPAHEMAADGRFAVSTQPRFPLRALLFSPLYDGADAPPSRLRLSESGRELGPSHASHDYIRSVGHGAYSDWNGRLWFSSSDGSDPRTNGREYRAQTVLHLRPAASLVGILAAGVLLFIAARGNPAASFSARTARRARATLHAAPLWVREHADALATTGIATTAAISIAFLIAYQNRPWQEQTITPDQFALHVSGTYIARPELPRSILYEYTLVPGATTSVKLQEGTTPLQQASGGPETVQRGRFLVWFDGLVISPSRQLDAVGVPQHFRFTARASVADSAVRAAAILFLAGISVVLVAAASNSYTRERISRRLGVLVFAFCAAVLVISLTHYFLVEQPVQPGLTPDSDSYLSFNPMRTVGLGLFYRLIDFTGLNWSWLPIVQVWILCAALIFLGYAVARSAGSWWWGVLFILIVSQLEATFGSAPYIMSEWLFIALLAGHLAVALVMLRRPTAVNALAMGITLAGLVLVKAVGFVFTAPATLLALRFRSRPLIVLAIVGPALLAYALPALWNGHKYGVVTPSLLGGAALAGHVGWMIGVGKQGEDEALAGAIRDAVDNKLPAPPARETLEQYVARTSEQYNPMLWGIIVPIVHAHFAERLGCETDTNLLSDPLTIRCFVSTSQALGELANGAVATAPQEYVSHVFAHYIWMWTASFPDLSLAWAISEANRVDTNDVMARIQRAGGFLHLSAIAHSQLNAPGDIHPAATAFRIALLGEYDQPLLAFLRDWAGLVLLGVSLLGCVMVVALHRLSPPLAGFVYAALLANAYCLGHALFQVYLSRYAVVIQPVIIAMGLLAVIGLTTETAVLMHWMRRRASAVRFAPLPSRRETQSAAGPEVGTPINRRSFPGA